jgi:hypothetical protein
VWQYLTGTHGIGRVAGAVVAAPCVFVVDLSEVVRSFLREVTFCDAIASPVLCCKYRPGVCAPRLIVSLYEIVTMLPLEYVSGCLSLANTTCIALAHAVP